MLVKVGPNCICNFVIFFPLIKILFIQSIQNWRNLDILHPDSAPVQKIAWGWLPRDNGSDLLSPCNHNWMETGCVGQCTHGSCFILLHYRWSPLLICIKAPARDAKSRMLMRITWIVWTVFFLLMDEILQNFRFSLDQHWQTFF